jgi:ribosomal protein L37AE/L43A
MPTRKISDLPKGDTCRHPDHDPPTMMVLSPGVYEHECPSCGRKIVFRVDAPTMDCGGGGKHVVVPMLVPKWYMTAADGPLRRRLQRTP